MLLPNFITYKHHKTKFHTMKNLSLYSILLAIVPSFSLHAMHQYYSSLPLAPVEREIFKDAVKMYGLDNIRTKVNDQSIDGLLLEYTLNKKEVEVDHLTKNIFNEIERIESMPENKANLRTKRQHFTLRTWYHRDWHNLDVVYVTMKSSNIKELKEICDSYTE